MADLTLAAVLNSRKAGLNGIFRDPKNRKVWSRFHSTKTAGTIDTQDENADDLEGHVPVTGGPDDTRPPHKGHAYDTARSRIPLLAIDVTNGRLFISFVERKVALDLLLRLTNQSIADLDSALINAVVLIRDSMRIDVGDISFRFRLRAE